MSSIISSVVFVKSVSGEKVHTGIAYSRIDHDEFIKINFKAFRYNNEIMIQEIKENSIMLMIGRFLNFESELFVTVIQATTLDLKTLEEEPDMHDLPIAPLFGSFTSPCKMAAKQKDEQGQSYFILERNVYNSFTTAMNKLMIPCTYATSNGRELFIGTSLIQIICSEIEWSFPNAVVQKSEKSKTQKGKIC
ncbi:4204_t:CDS:2 [Funneliformis geosporum]|uniref:4204_t:CDS:1 n=1 Tax=Funneliformis geosporum TaxID=1117311 RepID=A0A9W4X6Z6_9GLOM|nr:4204_t:CDS:2 [Funneliformis geosporum]